jgi:hypothetical protein
MGYHASRINIDIRWRTLLGDFMEEFLRYVVEYVGYSLFVNTSIHDAVVHHHFPQLS